MARQTHKSAGHPATPSDGRPSAQSRKAAQILPAACDLFLEHGFDPVTMDMVAARSGVSKATLYVYFASKEDLFAAVVDAEVKLISDRIDVSPCHDGNIVAALRRMARSFVDLFLSDRVIALQRTVYGVLPRFPGIGPRIYAKGPMAVTDRIANLIASAHDDGLLDVEDPHRAAKQFVSLVRDDHDLMGLLVMPPPDQSSINRSIDASIEVFMARYGQR